MRKEIKATKRTAAIGYVRVSTGKQASEGGSLEEQAEALAFYAATNGLDLIGVESDAGISGSRDQDGRPGLARALDAVNEGRATVLLVRDVSRLARDLDLIGFLRVTVRRAGGVVKVVGESEDRIYRLFDAVKAEMYRTAVVDRMKLWAAQRKVKGLPLGRAPYGYAIGADHRLVPKPEEQPVLERIRALRASGLSLRAIVAVLDGEGIASPTGKAWSAQTLNLILKRDVEAKGSA